MPHVIFDNGVNLEEFSLRFQNISQEKPFQIKIDKFGGYKERNKC